ncbi:MAG: threonine synthase [Gammaproteobacteria bacterium]|jgi:threonine synthase|nr:threonine synthase [Gammaproteobacteria bacterium]
MNYLSTIGKVPVTDLAGALRAGLAPDGGLYVPEQLPRLSTDALADCSALPDTAERLLAGFFDGSELESELSAICREALDLPLPLVEIESERSWILELFHGPTAAFKDFAARFLAACMQRLRRSDDPVQTVLVATSGDTGGAVAAAFHRRPGFRVVILYPDGRVSARQAHQLGAFGDNIHTFRIQGNFDDCQRLVKRALNDETLAGKLALTSANSISIGRLLPQISYYAHATARLQATVNGPIDVIVPTGNLGNALACILARNMGLPISEIVLATNANPTLQEYFSGLDYKGRPGIETLANAMDVGDPSNFERLAWFYRNDDLRQAGISAVSVDDATIRQRIQRIHAGHGTAVCPHTACALEALAQRRSTGNDQPHLIAATAHPAKFESVVEPLLAAPIDPPPALAELLQSSSHAEPMNPDFESLRRTLTRFR